MDQTALDLKKKSPLHLGALISFFVFIIGMIFVLFIWNLSQQNLADQSQEKFDQQISNITKEISSRFSLYSNGLYSSRGLFYSSTDVARNEWIEFVNILNLPQNYPGANSMSFIQYVPDPDKAAFIQSIRDDKSASASGYPSAQIHPDTSNPVHYLYKYFAPVTNVANLGLDVGTDPTRLSALEHARDTGLPTGTGLIFAQGTNEKSFVTYMPIYKNSSPSASLEDRQQNLLGFTTIGLQTKSFFNNVFNNDLVSPELNFEIYDNDQKSSDHLLFDSNAQLGDAAAPQKGEIYKTVELPIVEKDWHLYIRAPKFFGLTATEKQLPNIILFGGSGISLLLAMILFLIINSRNQAIQMASQMTSKLRDSESRLKSILLNMSEGLVVSGADGKFNFFNQTAEKMLGVGMSQENPEAWQKTYGVFLADMKTPFPLDKFPLTRALKGEEPRNVEQYIKNAKLNEGIFISVNGDPLKDDAGKIIGAIAVFRDITERKKAERNLNEAQHAGKFGSFSWDLATNVITWSEELFHLMNIPVSDKAPTIEQFGQLIYFEDRDKLTQGIKDAMISDKPFVDEIRVPYDDKTIHWMKVRGKTVYKDGKPIQMVGTLQDSTSEKELIKLKDEFVSIASHELRTPMTAIKGFITMIEEGDYGSYDKGLDEPLSDIQSSVERLIYLVNDMLNVSRIESGRMKFNLAVFDIKPTIEEIVASLQPIVKGKKLIMTSKGIESSIVSADNDKVKQILNNVLGNSLKFTDQGSITVSTKRDGQFLKIYVTDTGMGIASTDQIKLFGKFEQINSQQVGRPAGTGLGLYLSKQLCNKMGGDLWIDHSQPGKGSTFAFSVPILQSEIALKVKSDLEKDMQVHPDQKND